MMQITRRRKWPEINEHDLLELLKSSIILSITDSLGRLLFVNDNYCTTFGRIREHILGESHSLLESARHKNPIYKELWSTIKRGETWKGVLPNTNKKSKIHWLETTIVPVINVNGSVKKYITYCSDVTKIQEDKNKINELLNNYSSYVESIPNLVLSVNKLGKIITANRDIRSVKVDQVIGRSVYGFINPIFHDLALKNIEAVFYGATRRQFEIMDQDTDGSEIYYLSEISPAFNKERKIISATISVRNITNIRKVKHQFRDNNAKYRNIFKSIDVGIIVVADDQGNITEWNKGAELAFGYTESDIIGCHLTRIIASKFRKRGMKELIAAVNKLKVSRVQETIEMYGLKKNGQEFPVEFALSKCEKGKNAYYCAVMLDISKSKSLENSLKAKTKDLELFLYRSAHDMKAPFSSAEGIINLIKDEDINSNVSQLTSMLETTMERGKLLLDNLAMASVITDRNIKKELIDFPRMVKEIFCGLKGTTHYENVDLKLRMIFHIDFYSNKELLTSLLQNLIQNVVKYSKQCQDSIEPFVCVEISSLKNEIQILVKDNGRGILDANLDKIFDLYYREDNGEIPGVGIGLYLVKNIVDNLKGEINVTSEFSKGTCFEIKLPVSNK